MTRTFSLPSEILWSKELGNKLVQLKLLSCIDALIEVYKVKNGSKKIIHYDGQWLEDAY